jgi:hypothetical protein
MVNGAHAIVPIAYYVYWVVLIGILLLVLGYWAIRPRMGNTKLLAGMLVLLIGLLYAIDQLPVLHLHFDVEATKFMAGYHEPLAQAFIKFAYKVGIALLLLSYAFSNMQKH